MKNEFNEIFDFAKNRSKTDINNLMLNNMIKT